MSYRMAALNGVAWSLGSQALRMGFQVATTIVLARLLTPHDFGVYAMALPVIALAGLLQDFGMQQAILQKRDITNDQINALFWINFSLTVAVALALAAASPFIARFYSEPLLTPMLAGWSGILVFGALSFGHHALLTRKLLFKTVAMIDMVCATVSFVTVLIVSWFWPSPWAMWFAGLSSVICWVSLAYATKIWFPSRPKRGVKLDGMFAFGANIMLHSLANFVSRNADNIIIGRAFGSAVLGYYDRAYKLLLYPVENLGNPIARVMVPVLSKLQDDNAGFRRAFLQVLGLMNLVAMPGMAVAIGCSVEVVQILLGDKWLPVAEMFWWLGFAGLVQPLINASGWMLIAQGRSEKLMWISVTSSIVTVIGFVVGMKWGAVGVAAAYAMVECFFRAPITCYLGGRKGAVRGFELVVNTAPLFVSAVLSLFTIDLVRSAGIGGWALIAISLLLAYLEALAILSLFPSGRAVIRASIHLALGALQRLRG